MTRQRDECAAGASDLELLSLWSQGDRKSGNQLFQRHFPAVYRFFSNKVSGDIDDLVQRTFLGCIEARARYQQRASFKTFLFSIARNQLYLHYRTRKRDGALDFSVASVHDMGTTPSGAVACREHERLLLDALRRLPLDTQILVELAYWEELEVQELAEVLDVPVNTLYSRLRRARHQLREHLTTFSAHEPQQWQISYEALERWAFEVRDATIECVE